MQYNSPGTVKISPSGLNWKLSISWLPNTETMLIANTLRQHYTDWINCGYLLREDQPIFQLAVPTTQEQASIESHGPLFMRLRAIFYVSTFHLSSQNNLRLQLATYLIFWLIFLWEDASTSSFNAIWKRMQTNFRRWCNMRAVLWSIYWNGNVL